MQSLMNFARSDKHLTANTPAASNSVAARIAQQLRDLARQLEQGLDVPALNSWSQGRSLEPPDLCRPDYLLKVRKLLKERNARRAIFGAMLVEDPSWAILLELFEARMLQEVRCVKSICIASGVPSTTALRYLQQLELEGLVTRSTDSCDKRRTIVGLTETGLRKFLRYFDGA